ncbi:MAG: tetraacyldisaccharide 4'-kinase [Pedobacter sp.]|nr:MAG: tetraacyldisaccharide 4'-kinase [Pedobacter sp.]
MIILLRYLLFPVSVIYGLVTHLRNKLYDWNVLKSVAFDLPVICIGNLAVGGAGKTPTTEYVVRLLSDYKVAVLSRGYGRKTKGFIKADQNATVATIGDEPLQYYHKFSQITVAVCEDRVFGIDQLKIDHDVILLDDAYQHRAVRAGFNLLLFEFDKLLKWQFLMPTGNLREYFGNYNRAQAVLVTKSPDPVNIVDQIDIRKKIDLSLEQRISFSSIKYGDLLSFDNKVSSIQLKGQTVFLVTGIANPRPLISYVEKHSQEIIQFEYPDHYQFKRDDLKSLINELNKHPAKEKIIITTEKDSKRLLDDNLKDLLLNLPIFFLPIELELAKKDKFTFDKNILDYVARNKRIG